MTSFCHLAGTCQLVAALVASATAMAQVGMPPVNLGGSSFMDGVAGPGVLFQPIIMEHYHAGRFVDYRGADIPGRNTVDSWANLVHVSYITKHRLLGGFYGAEFLLPVATVDINTTSGPKDSQSGIGDVLVSPLIIEYPKRTLFARTYFSRFSVLAILPTGVYAAERRVNVGSNAGGAFAYYAFTLFLQPKWETSWRLHYLWNAKNTNPFRQLAATSTQAGQAFHLNYATSYELSRSLRLGLNGYFLQQLTDNRLGDVAIVNSKERVAAVGPGLVWSYGFWSVFGNFDFEALARNRPEGYRLNVTVRRVFPHMISGPAAGATPQ